MSEGNDFFDRLNRLESNLLYLKENCLEDAIIPFVKNQEKVRTEWRNVEGELGATQKELDAEKKLRNQAEIRLRVIRYELDAETKRRSAAEDKRDELLQQLSDMQCLLDGDTSSVHLLPSAPPVCGIEDHSSSALYPSMPTHEMKTHPEPTTRNHHTGILKIFKSRKHSPECVRGFPEAPTRIHNGFKPTNHLKETLTTNMDSGSTDPDDMRQAINAAQSQDKGLKPIVANVVTTTTTTTLTFDGPVQDSKARRKQIGRAANHSILSVHSADTEDGQTTPSASGPDNPDDSRIQSSPPGDNADPKKMYVTRRTTKDWLMRQAMREEERNTLVPSAHHFANKTFFKPEACKTCTKKINFGRVALRCQQCAICVHVECQLGLRKRCLLRMREMNGGAPRKNLIDFCPSVAPYIPPLIYYCINEIERRGLQTEGLYRVSSSEQKLRSLRNAFVRKRTGCPDLSRVVDVHTLCCLVKDFLKSLPEPLITFNHWHKFAVAKADDLGCTPRSIRRLPNENQHTLAYTMLHLLLVAESPSCRMGTANLCKIFGPVIVGNSSSEPSKYRMMYELTIQKRAMESIFAVDRPFWLQILLDAKSTVSSDCQSHSLIQSPVFTPKRAKQSPRLSTAQQRRKRSLKAAANNDSITRRKKN